MSMADKLQTIAENEQKVYDAGKLAERKAFWDTLQNNGNGANYYFAFAYGRFTDENYEPQHDIVCRAISIAGQNLFTASPGITDTKVPIYANSISAAAMFNSNSGLKTIRLFVVEKTTTFVTCFTGCTALENLTIGGEIGQNINVSDCTKLTHQSLMSIIDHLYDYSTEGGTYTLTMGTTNQEKLTESEIALITQKGWTLA